MVAAVREGQRRMDYKQRPGVVHRKQEEGGQVADRRPRDMICVYCNKKGHMKRECRQRAADEKMFKED